ncbi:MAG: hypothetical protein C0404_13085, partial [Verrucomicrobia bacterium]|nr:hypothetical protein [Verrucomicrobiota bacterium]
RLARSNLRRTTDGFAAAGDGWNLQASCRSKAGRKPLSWQLGSIPAVDTGNNRFMAPAAACVQRGDNLLFETRLRIDKA